MGFRRREMTPKASPEVTEILADSGPLSHLRFFSVPTQSDICLGSYSELLKGPSTSPGATFCLVLSLLYLFVNYEPLAGSLAPVGAWSWTHIPNLGWVAWCSKILSVHLTLYRIAYFFNICLLPRLILQKHISPSFLWVAYWLFGFQSF